MNWQDSHGHVNSTGNIARMLREREFNGRLGRPFKSAALTTESMLKRLALLSRLEGHKGCVNCLEWSEDGSILLSGSDDTTVRVWDPYAQKIKSVINTSHCGNIFSTKFLPGTNSTHIATAAGDALVTVIDLNARRGESTNGSSSDLLNCNCHLRRVKRIATASGCPSTIWTAGEDGLVLQIDLRQKHTCQTSRNSGPAVLLDLELHYGRGAEAKCVTINPVKQHLIAIGANDAYARIFDRRMMKTYMFKNVYYTDVRQHFEERFSNYSSSLTDDCAKYFTPGHSVSPNSDANLNSLLPKFASTYVEFSPSGNELLVNLGGDHVYLYDINGEGRVKTQFTKTHLIDEELMGDGAELGSCCNDPVIQEQMTNSDFDFDEKLGRCCDIPFVDNNQCSCYLIRRADLLMKRKWWGDYYAAARDYFTAIEKRGGMSSSLSKRPLIGFVYALHKLNWTELSTKWFDTLEKFHFRSRNEYSALTDAIQLATRNPNLQGPTRFELLNSSSYATFLPDEIKLKVKEEKVWQDAAVDYRQRYVGHCNITTDIKEVSFIGQNGQFIAAGSDDGIMYIWRASDAKIVNALKADLTILNCIQPHPFTCLIASSGIETSVKLWQPISDEALKFERHVLDAHEIDTAIETNQQRLGMDGFESILSSMGIDASFDIMPPPRIQAPICHQS